MDADLKQAACLGDIEFLHRAYATKSTDYFLSYYSSPDGDHDIMGNIFHLAARKVKLEFMREAMKILPDELVLRLLSQQDEDDWNPLHVATSETDCLESVRLILGFYKSLPAQDHHHFGKAKPWLALNNNNCTPFHIALRATEKTEDDEECALGILSMDNLESFCNIVDDDGNSPLFYAVKNGFNRVAEMILLSSPSSFAKESRVPWLVKLLKNPSLIQKEPFDWIAACQQNENWAVAAFIDSCQDLQKVCREKQDTPLHHIRFRTYEECLKFLKKSSIAELKNSTDFEGATPLHRALERKDKHLAKALLIDDVVERNIADNHGTTAMNLLSKLCKENDEWESMCKEIKINPHLKTTYIQSRTNLDQMRNTLSVVAALLATITFAAGFTLPGGLNQETGNAMLAKRASFIVFLLADVYAMCTSMLVMFCLIWSMVCDRDMSYLLVDRSVFILMQSLYGTMVAFMTGIYTVINHSTLWVSIVIFVMCSLIGISANRTVLHTILSKFIPASNRDNKDRGSSREQRSASSCRMDESRNAEGSSSHQNQDHIDDHHLERLEEGKASIVGNDMDSKKAK